MNKIINKIDNFIPEVYGDNNEIIFGQNVSFYPITSWYCNRFRIGTPDCLANGCKIIIGNNVTSNGIFISIGEDNTVVTIGDDCMFSDNISIYASDTHSIFDNDTKKLLNEGKFVTIGNHVWVCQDARIMKNTIIPDNCVIGNSAVVCGQKFKETNCVIAGNPARVVKRNINWSRERPKQYMLINP